MPIRITSAVEGFRRAGMRHPRAAQLYADDFFSEAQIAQLKAEPRLSVSFISDEEAAAAQAADPQGALVPGVLSTGVEGAPGENRLQPLIDTIAKLDPQDASLWNQDGTPKASVFPKGTSAADRANAWAMFQSQAGEA